MQSIPCLCKVVFGSVRDNCLHCIFEKVKLIFNTTSQAWYLPIVVTVKPAAVHMTGTPGDHPDVHVSFTA